MSPTVASNPGRRARHNLCHLGFRSCFFVLCLFLALPTPSSQASALGKRDLVHLSSSALSSITAHPDPVKNIDPTNPSSHLSKILIPRVPDTENNTAVRQYIVSTLTQLNWHIEEDSFTDSTPYGEKRFTNVIATKDPRAPRRVIVAAHFDSKFFSTFPQNQFVGATDSAAPCAFMLDLAEALNPMLDKRLRRISRRDDDEDDDDDDDDDDDGDEDEDDDLMDTTLQFVFFDGEEAFKDWTATDSIYGARHLAQKWATTHVQPNAKRRLLPLKQINEIAGIEQLILLDLLGSVRPLIRSSFSSTGWLFDAMVSAETRLAEMGAFVYDGDGATTKDKWTSFFMPRTGLANLGFIEDDHIPFLRLGVDILHVIANPFPTVWHTIKDDASALDIPTMRRWNLILRVLMCEYLGLRVEDLEDKRSPTNGRSHSELS